jgi:hypothetical protein
MIAKWKQWFSDQKDKLWEDSANMQQQSNEILFKWKDDTMAARNLAAEA